MNILSAREISKSYTDSDQRIIVLEKASLEVEQGALISITGQSGCGKSTLLHILGLLDEPDSGQVFIKGKQTSSQSPDAPAIRNQDIGFVFQFHYLIEDLCARENVALPLLIAGQKLKDALSEADRLLELLSLGQRVSHYPNQLSGGEQQRVALARALITRPAIVLADEPTGNLDPGNSLEVWNLIRKLNRELGQTFVVVTHDREQAKLADQTLELSKGQVRLL
ncbi:MAG: ABC transporter ATP-binding protein [Candidatus Cloacimonetes bacterium]|nr:ABC transporter ATP-binding protein [Candidatus Cloacimonadota bacterium]HNZ06187.1 ABC transporter ATP-binding protein [Candidatus Cloacimonadota bacterium]HOH78212.1 ABC transporter ATP-binding protein [Candidatus Cloacimonadota bacterium]HPN39988.1 ABC transporter ATP-binding protein [Candidatus Cloacimonadota bacterium]